ncbi:hypothetical protein F5Y05DRAFT_413303 [Hypoxylon sp. FL0543]|nr:hypothetical protein F5Y05DRAFT_413303 [Hypoxylon sp. FL0543]
MAKSLLPQAGADIDMWYLQVMLSPFTSVLLLPFTYDRVNNFHDDDYLFSTAVVCNPSHSSALGLKAIHYMTLSPEDHSATNFVMAIRYPPFNFFTPAVSLNESGLLRKWHGTIRQESKFRSGSEGIGFEKRPAKKAQPKP